MPLSLPTPDLIQRWHQMRGNLLQGPSHLHHYSCIHHCYPFTSITHNFISLLHRHSFFLSILFVTFLSTSHLSHQIPLFSSTSPPPFSPMSKSFQHTLLCLTSQLSCNNSPPSHLLISPAYTHPCTHTYTLFSLSP